MTEIKQEETKQPEGDKRKTLAKSVFILLALVSIVSVFFYLRYKSTHISTDDAFIEGNIHTVASKINGTVKAVLVKANQAVKKGDVLVEIDPADYGVKVKEAETSLEAERSRLNEYRFRVAAAKRQIAELESKAMAAKANLDLQQAGLIQAEKDRKRAESLFKKDVISKERYEKTMTGYDVGVALVNAAREQLRQAEAGIETQRALASQSEAALNAQQAMLKPREAVREAAELSLGYTKIIAPADGYVTKKSVEVGNQIQPGQPLMAVVPLDDIHVIANFKETQLEKIKQGQKVEIKVDAYPGKKFKGTVESIMSGTGASFSLFPPENATGNFVKVVQRIPVKILFDKDTDREHMLRVGMSVEPTVLVEK